MQTQLPESYSNCTSGSNLIRQAKKNPWGHGSRYTCLQSLALPFYSDKNYLLVEIGTVLCTTAMLPLCCCRHHYIFSLMLEMRVMYSDTWPTLVPIMVSKILPRGRSSKTGTVYHETYLVDNLNSIESMFVYVVCADDSPVKHFEGLRNEH